LGSNFTRRTQVAFPWDADRAFFRGLMEVGHHGEFIHSGVLAQAVVNCNTQPVRELQQIVAPLMGTLTGH
jgi:hypothetical protein